MLERRNSRSIEVLLQVYFEEPKNIKLYVIFQKPFTVIRIM